MQVKGNQGQHVHKMTENRSELKEWQTESHCKNRASKQTKQTNKQTKTSLLSVPMHQIISCTEF